MPRKDTTAAKGTSCSSVLMNRIKVKAPARRGALQFFPAQLFWTVSQGFVVKLLHNAVPQKKLYFMPTTVFNYSCIGNRWHITTFCFVCIARVLVLTNFVLQFQSVSFPTVLHPLTIKSKTCFSCFRSSLFSKWGLWARSRWLGLEKDQGWVCSHGRKSTSLGLKWDEERLRHLLPGAAGPDNISRAIVYGEFWPVRSLQKVRGVLTWHTRQMI